MKPELRFDAVYQAYQLDLKARALAASYQAGHDLTRRAWLAKHGDMLLADIQPDHVRAWLAGLTGLAAEEHMSPGTVSQYYIKLKTFWNWCVAEELIARSPFRNVRAPKVPQTLPDVLTEDEVVKLLKRVRNAPSPNAYRDYCMILFFLDTGVRVAELTALKIDQVNIEAGWAKVVGKGSKERLVPLGLELRAALSRYLLKYRAAVPGERTLFTSREGRGMVKQTVSETVKAHLDRIGRPIRRSGPHTLRHTFATLYLRRQGDLKRTSLIMGHTSTDITERYTHLTGTDVLIDAGGSHIDRLIRHGGG